MEPTKGRTVLYTANLTDEYGMPKVVTYPGMITSIEFDFTVNLVVFFDHHVTGIQKIGHPTSVPYSPTKVPHSWKELDMDLDLIPAPEVVPIEEGVATKPHKNKRKK